MLSLEIGELMLQLARGMLAERDGDSLTSAQWFALRFFSRANAFSRTLSGLAAYQATTRGTASQTIKFLEQNGYLVRKRSVHDGRSFVLTLTEKARKRMREDPLAPIFGDIEALDVSRQAVLRDVLRELAGRLGGAERRQVAGSCGDCIFLLIRRLKSHGSNVQTNFFCQCNGRALSEKELGLLCMSFQAKTTPFDA